MRRLGLALLLIASLGTACDGSDSESTTTSLGVITTAIPDSTTTVVPTTSTAGPSTTEPASLTIHLMSSRLYSPDEKVRISGWVDRLGVEVLVDEVMADTGEHGGASTGFDYEAILEPGEHDIGVTAVDSSGRRTTESLHVIVDPDLEKELAYVQDIDPATDTLVADYIQMLDGDEAIAAAREDGYIGADEDLPGGFYIRNQNPR
ncbi:MAG TPA: hypothetical protein VE569_07730, partial [Acidimicrobiia bacterium]|nr:hypothetical protein [Acidimicrobiia bacterium]